VIHCSSLIILKRWNMDLLVRCLYFCITFTLCKNNFGVVLNILVAECFCWLNCFTLVHESNLNPSLLLNCVNQILTRLAIFDLKVKRLKTFNQRFYLHFHLSLETNITIYFLFIVK
jgi:hypothetical protein